MKRNKIHTLFILLFTFTILLSVIPVTAGAVEEPDDGIPVNGYTAVIDAVLSPGEWDNAETHSFYVDVPSSDVPVEAVIRVMNDSNNRYISLELLDSNVGRNNNYNELRFDTDLDGVLETGEFFVSWKAPSEKYPVSGTLDCANLTVDGDCTLVPDGSTDVTGAYDGKGGTVIYEYMIPLSRFAPSSLCTQKVGMKYTLRSNASKNKPTLISYYPAGGGSTQVIMNFCDNCVETANANQADVENDGVGDVCDNCVDVANNDQTNDDNDPLGAACDCDDNDPNNYAGNAEVCDGQDNDCDGSMLAVEADDDSDGVMICEGDCNDTDATIFAGAPELCDGKDNNCDGTLPANEADDDSDGYMVCEADCNDTDASIFAGAPELCDGQDNDCDGTLPANEIDNDGDSYVECAIDENGWDGAAISGGDDCDDTNETIYAGAPELCDGLVNTCGGTLPANEIDNDGDSYVECVIDENGWDGAAISGGDDCDDTNETIYAGAPELCDGLVNTCGGTLPANEADDDADGFMICQNDCDDTALLVNPAAAEVCNDIDDNCDGSVDEGMPDYDQDGICNALDNCEMVANIDQADVDGDGVGNVCDNCPMTANAGQEDNNGIDDFTDPGDACEGDWQFYIKDVPENGPNDITACNKYTGGGASLMTPLSCETLNFLADMGGITVPAPCSLPPAPGIGLAEKGEGDLECFSQDADQCLAAYGVTGISESCVTCNLADIFGDLTDTAEISVVLKSFLQDPDKTADGGCAAPEDSECFDVTISSAETAETVTIIPVDLDFKPNAYPNTINPGDNGVQPFAVLGSNEVDATIIDPESIILRGNVSNTPSTCPPKSNYTDINLDGMLDLQFHIDTQCLQIGLDDTEFIMDAKTYDGASVMGKDSMEIVQ